MESLNALIDTLNGWLYGYILVALLVVGGIYFTVRLQFLPTVLLKEAIRTLAVRGGRGAGTMSSFQALMVSTASRVGTGNIIGVTAAILAGGPGAVFWMWIIAVFGAASAFVESTLAQMYKCRDAHGFYYGGPAYYIRKALHAPVFGGVFAAFVILLYMGGFNALCSFNTTDFICNYARNVPHMTVYVGFAFAALAGLVILGGGKFISRVTQFLVPIMAGGYIVIALAVMVLHITDLPGVMASILAQAFDLHSAFGGFLGAAIMMGVKRGLYSNEAGVGSAPNAAASADVKHPVNQGLAQFLSVFIDTILICSATAFIVLCSGVDPAGYVAGTDNTRFLQDCMSASFGGGGGVLLTCALVIFAYTTLVGNYFYAEQSVRYFYPNAHIDRKFMTCYRIVAILVIFAGSQFKAAFAWNLSDLIMGMMALVNIPVCIFLGKHVYKALWDYMIQRSRGKVPTFDPEKTLGTAEGMECWCRIPGPQS
ncbi:MAG: alanine:cation symporter family protein [Kiritimatiellae bacterium]|nr:alanine:cation symporter family protein [Kiritimatiellia bacterium]